LFGAPIASWKADWSWYRTLIMILVPNLNTTQRSLLFKSFNTCISISVGFPSPHVDEVRAFMDQLSMKIN
jgi:hypothetical protein